MYLLRLPKADENMTEATVITWLRSEGERVAEGENVVECVAEKGEFMLYVEEGGVIRKIYAAPQSVLPVGYVLAAVGRPEEALPEVEAENAALLKKARQELVFRSPDGTAPREPVRATPAARRLARERGVRLGEVASALGIEGAVIIKEEHVRAYLDEKAEGGEGGGG